MKRTDPIVASPWSPLAERLRAFAAAATELATDVELALADAGEATRTLEAMRAALGLPSAPAPVVRATAPTARPKRSAATSSNAGPSSAPTHCEAPGCGRALVQAGGRWKHYCDPKCRARSARAARDVGVVDQVVADDHAPPAPVALATIETPPLVASPRLVPFDVEADRREEFLAISELAITRRMRMNSRDARLETIEDLAARRSPSPAIAAQRSLRGSRQGAE